MKEITLKVPEKKLNFFMELVKQLGIETKDESMIPEWQQEQLDKALEEHKSGAANYTDWNEAKKSIFAKYKVK